MFVQIYEREHLSDSHFFRFAVGNDTSFRYERLEERSKLVSGFSHFLGRQVDFLKISCLIHLHTPRKIVSSCVLTSFSPVSGYCTVTVRTLNVTVCFPPQLGLTSQLYLYFKSKFSP